ncbi:hypothetical protein CDD83_10035 [Cordyceps sp. RAO-2017]|nr:hypothetical protein CDD83_10035 [Cordyceps sp. RAO-2017]
MAQRASLGARIRHLQQLSPFQNQDRRPRARRHATVPFGGGVFEGGVCLTSRVLDAVQRQDSGQIRQTFVAWAEALRDAKSPQHRDAVEQARQMPATTLSELLRCIDPIRNPQLDVAHGLHLSSGLAQFTPVGHLMDEFGVRTVHRQVLDGVQALMEIRAESRGGLAPADYEVMMRCAGAAVDPMAAKRFFAAMAVAGLQQWRTTRTWTEFVKARFMVEPAYYQFDRSRVVVLPRDWYGNQQTMPYAMVKYLESIRHSLNTLRFYPWNRRRDAPDQDWRRFLRTRHNYRSYAAHFRRAIAYGIEVDEEFLCASIVAFSRSSSESTIRTLILEYHYGLVFRGDGDEERGKPAVSGGRDMAPESAIRPTARLLDAIVEAYGSMSMIGLCVELVEFVSRRWAVPIPARTWSNLLSWTFVCSSRPYSQMRRFQSGGPPAARCSRSGC